MSSEVTICNLALSYLGDSATVSSIDPPEGSMQAEHCARFYPVAREALLESHAWGFCIRRVTLALLVSAVGQWEYTYAVPNRMIKALMILSPDARDDGGLLPAESGYFEETTPFNSILYPSRPFIIETLADGSKVICTDQEDAVLRCTILVTDVSKYSPLARIALSWMLAAMLAGPVIKGKEGSAKAKECLAVADEFINRARVSDSNQQNLKPMHTPPWLRR